jgi:hypothetical protein
MRARLFIVSSLAIAAVFGAANAAQAQPQGPGDIKYQPKPTTTTTQPPKGPDKVAQPTTTTTTPPKPKGPGDIANPPSDPVVDPAPTGNGSGSDLDYPTTQGDDEANLVNGDDNGNGNGAVVESDPAAQVADTNTAATPADANDSSDIPVIVVVLLAGGLGALLALFATRMRRHDDEHGSQV